MGGDKSPPTSARPIFVNRANPLIFGGGRGGGRRGPSPGFLSFKHKNFNKSLDKASREPGKYHLTAKYHLLTVIRYSYSVSAITFLTFSGFFNFRFHSLPCTAIHHIISRVTIFSLWNRRTGFLRVITSAHVRFSAQKQAVKTKKRSSRPQTLVCSETFQNFS